MVEQYRHKKRGTVYEVIASAELQDATGSATEGATLVVYRGEDGKVWARQEDEFHDGRFEPVETPSPSLVSGDVVEAVARALCEAEEANWNAANFNETLSGETPEEMRSRYMALARAALSVSDPLVRQLVDAEREACAKIADLAADVNDYTDKPSMKVAQDHARGIAARIRNRAGAIASLQHKEADGG